jgi:hypothetical protein
MIFLVAGRVVAVYMFIRHQAAPSQRSDALCRAFGRMQSRGSPGQGLPFALLGQSFLSNSPRRTNRGIQPRGVLGGNYIFALRHGFPARSIAGSVNGCGTLQTLGESLAARRERRYSRLCLSGGGTAKIYVQPTSSLPTAAARYPSRFKSPADPLLCVTPRPTIWSGVELTLIAPTLVTPTVNPK